MPSLLTSLSPIKDHGITPQTKRQFADFSTTHLLYEGQTPPNKLEEVRTMSILKMLRESTEPLTVAELAGLMTVTAATVLRWVRNRQVPFIRVGDVIRFDGEALADWLELEGACNERSTVAGLDERGETPGAPET
jgi:excisionase family DNA binding protein